MSVSDLLQVDDFFRILRFPPPIKLTVHDITEILLTVAFSIVSHDLSSFLRIQWGAVVVMLVCNQYLPPLTL